MAIQNVTRVEASAKKLLSMMSRDCSRFCKIMVCSLFYFLFFFSFFFKGSVINFFAYVRHHFDHHL